MTQTLARNKSSLTEFHVLKVISNYTGKSHNELIENDDNSENTQEKDRLEIQKDEDFTAVRTSNVETVSELCNKDYK